MTHHRNVFLYLLLAAVIIVLSGVPYQIAAQDLPSEPRGHVSDFANMLTSNERQSLERKLRNYRDTTTNVIAVATLNSLEGYPVEEIGTRLFNEWKMWHEDRYNGILVLIAKEERKIRIEVGYGLEGAVPDVMAGRIIREILNPAFKRGDYYRGLDRATSALIQLSEGEYEGSLAREESSGGSGGTVDLIVFILFLLIVFRVTSRRGGGKGKNKKRRSLGPGGIIWFGGGFGGGSGGGFGGGGFGGFSGGGGFGSGGGGASGGW